jgi:hypothetical protein
LGNLNLAPQKIKAVLQAEWQVSGRPPLLDRISPRCGFSEGVAEGLL